MTYQPIASEPPAPKELACTLTTKDGANQALEWSDLSRFSTSFDRVEHGATLTLPADRKEALIDLAAREAQCCAFLKLTVEDDGAEVRLTITLDQHDAQPVIDVLTGLIRP
jgi:hypothetical protein